MNFTRVEVEIFGVRATTEGERWESDFPLVEDYLNLFAGPEQAGYRYSDEDDVAIAMGELAEKQGAVIIAVEDA